MTYWQGMFIIGMLYFIVATTTRHEIESIIATLAGLGFTCYAGILWFA